MRNKRIFVRLAIVAIIGIFSWFSKNKSNKTSSDKTNSTSHRQSEKTQNGFTVYENCTLVNSKYNDGDSFLVNIGDSEQEYRLYYVDTPESRDKPYDDHRRRVEDQGRDMGGINYKQAIKVGQKAKKFTHSLLSKYSFSVYTKEELVFGGPRQYAFVSVEHDGNAEWLHEILVKEGLARIHTKGVTTPNGKTFQKQKSYLQSLSKF